MAIINKFLKPVSQEEVETIKYQTVGTLAMVPQYHVGESFCSPKDNFNVKNYFASKGFDVDLCKEKYCVAPIEDLAFMIAINYQLCKSFIKYLRDNIVKKCFHINYSLFEANDSEKKAILCLGEEFGEYGIISKYHYDKNTNVITGTIASGGRVVNFLNGDFLEFFGRAVAERVVNKEAQKYDVEYEIYSNVIITKDSKPHELDIVFRVGKNVFWSEIKSGKFSDFDCYRRLGILMGVNPDKHILLTAEKSSKVAAGASWLHQFFVANVETFEDKLIEMIDKAFKEV